MTVSDTSEGVAGFLAGYPPFDRLEPEAMDFMVGRLRRVRFDSHTTLAAAELGPPQFLYIVRAGDVTVTESAGRDGIAPAPIRLDAGDCFPIGALSGRRPPANTYVASAGSECYALAAGDFDRLTGMSAVFAQFCNNYLASLVERSRRELHVRFGQQTREQQFLTVRLSTLARKEPFAVAADTAIGVALERMVALGVGSVVVADDSRRPLGILTASDLPRRVVLARVALETAIGEVMSVPPLTLPESANVYDAMLVMATHGVRHVLLVDADGALTGVVSERDLFALQRLGVGQVRRAIASAPDLDTLRRASGDARRLAFDMLAQGVGAEQLTRFISAFNDGITIRIIELNLARHDFYGVDWAWLAFGSEGREEQTFATDQDNGIVFVCPDLMDREALQLRFVEFARDVNNDLDACGFPLCQGGIMAGNPSWCLTIEQWQDKFSQWLRVPEPKAVLNATIFFDLRAVYGARYLADRMYRHLFSLSRDNGAFQRILATGALAVVPPLGMFRDFVTESDDATAGFIDLKKSGSRLFVDAARILALAHGIFAANTAARLRRAAQISGSGDDAEALVEAFHFVQLLRLRHQHQATEQQRPGDNRVVPDHLNDLDRRILKEAFRQARKLQQRLRLNYLL